MTQYPDVRTCGLDTFITRAELSYYAALLLGIKTLYHLPTTRFSISQIYTPDVVSDTYTRCGIRYIHQMWYQIYTSGVVSVIYTRCGISYIHQVWLQLYTPGVVSVIYTRCGISYILMQQLGPIFYWWASSLHSYSRMCIVNTGSHDDWKEK